MFAEDLTPFLWAIDMFMSSTFGKTLSTEKVSLPERHFERGFNSVDWLSRLLLGALFLLLKTWIGLVTGRRGCCGSCEFGGGDLLRLEVELGCCSGMMEVWWNLLEVAWLYYFLVCLDSLTQEGFHYSGWFIGQRCAWVQHLEVNLAKTDILFYFPPWISGLV